VSPSAIVQTNVLIAQGLELRVCQAHTFRAKGTATFEELLSACVELGVTFMVCEMGLKAFDIEHGDLRDDISFAIGGVVTFLNDASYQFLKRLTR